MVGKKAGEDARVKVKFPKEYHKEEFSGKAAEFDVKINEVLTAQMPEVTDEFVKTNFGMENKEKLVEAVKGQLANSYEEMSRTFFKKEFFDFFRR